MKIRVVADRRLGRQDAEGIDPSDLEATAAWVARALDDGIETVVVVGDDATLGAVLTGYYELQRRRPEALAFALVDEGAPATVAAEVGAPTARRGLSRVERQVRSFHTRLLPTLRIVDSSTAVARIGFGVGMGSVRDLVTQDGGRRRRDTLRHSLRRAELVEAELVVDWEERTDGFGYLLASALPRSWGKVDMGAGGSVRVGDSLLDLVRGATKVGRVVERAVGGAPRAFDRVHIATGSDYVVDGLVMRGGVSRAVSIGPGPRVRLLAPGR